MEVLVIFEKEQWDSVMASLESMGFQRFAGYQGGVGDSTHIHGVIPDERFDSIRSIKGVENVENTDDLDYYE